MRWRRDEPRPGWLDPGRRATYAMRLAQHGLPFAQVLRIVRQVSDCPAGLPDLTRARKLRFMTWGSTMNEIPPVLALAEADEHPPEPGARCCA